MHTPVNILHSRILLVDDEAADLELLRRVLDRAGFQAIAATSDPRTACDLFRTFKPHLMLLDLHMPHMHGLAILEQVQSILPEVGAAVIVLTAEDDQTIKVQALRQGARDFITKPFNSHELLARVRHACEVQQLYRHLRDDKARLEAAVLARTARLESAIDVLRQAEAKLSASLKEAEAQSRAKDTMLAEAAHDFRSPLQAICGFAEIIRDRSVGPPESPAYREYANDIFRAARHLLGVVEDVLDLSGNTAGERHLELCTVSIGEVVQATASLLREEAERAGVRLTLQLPPAPLCVRTDETKVRRVLLNMISNAVKFTPRGGSVSVEVRAEPDGGAFVLIVRDTGIGIAPADMATALRPFGRVRNGRQTPEGTGLGMPLSKALVEALGGRFEIASEPGRGTCVMIRLPADARPDQREADRRAASI